VAGTLNPTVIKRETRRKVRDRRKGDSTAWVLGGSLQKDRRRGKDRRKSPRAR